VTQERQEAQDRKGSKVRKGYKARQAGMALWMKAKSEKQLLICRDLHQSNRLSRWSAL